MLGCLGLGVERPGDVACVAGTSTVVLGIAERLVIDPAHRYLITPLAGLDGWGFEMDLLTTGSAFRWLAGLLSEAGGDEATLMAMAARVEPGAGGLSFLPYLAPGEQGALWDPTISGAFFGLTLGHGAADVARALVDGDRARVAPLPVGARTGRLAARGGAHGRRQRRRPDISAAARRRLRGAGWSTPPTARRRTRRRGAAAVAAMAAGHGLLPAAAPTLETIAPHEDRSVGWDALWERHEAALRALRASNAAGA